MRFPLVRRRAVSQRFRAPLGTLAFYGTVVVSIACCHRAAAQSPSAGDFSASATAGAAQLRHGEETFQIVSAGDVETAADATSYESPGAAPMHAEPLASWPMASGCGSCGGACVGGCGATFNGCNSCGLNCRGMCGGGYAPFSGFGNPCAPCDPYWYVTAETLYMDRDGKESFTLSPNYNLSGFDQELGGRITVGSVPNCVDGFEASFTGVLEWDSAGALVAPGAGILTFLTTSAPLAATDLSAFNDTVIASSQRYEAKYWSVEANKSLISWDFAKLLYGLRFAQYDEDYFYTSQNNAGESGFLASTTDNSLIGVQGGLDLLYPISRHAFTDFRSRIGAFVNFADTDFGVINDGALVVANGDSEEDVAALIEIGGGIRYQLGELLAVRAGVEAWYLTGIAAANRQFGRVIAPQTGRDVSNGDDFLITGFVIGAELRY